MIEMAWLPIEYKGRCWSLYCKTKFSTDRGVVLGTIYPSHQGGWNCSNFRFRGGMQVGKFADLVSAAKWLLGYDIRHLGGRLTHEH